MGKSLQDHTKRIVWLVDDDLHDRNALQRFLHSNGYPVRSYGSAEAFLEDYSAAEYDLHCILADYCLTGMSGTEMQRLVAQDAPAAVIFMSAHAGIRETETAIRHGAIGFLEKPVDGTVLLERIDQAFEVTRSSREHHQLGKRLGRLSQREQQVLDMIFEGLATKNIAQRLDVSHKTIDVIRGRIRKKARNQDDHGISPEGSRVSNVKSDP